MYTNGPWVVYVETLDNGGWATPEQNITISSGDVIVASYSTGYSEYPDDSVNAANAQLIAAAPDLLSAAKLALSNLRRNLASEEACGHPFMGDDEHEAITVLTAAIAKATGGQ